MTPDDASHRLAAHIRSRLAEDARTVEYGIDVDVHDDVVVLRGQVATARRRALVEAVARESAAGLHVVNDVIVVERREPGGEPGKEHDRRRGAGRW
jgi:osmotically-inducible protein OsmY